jgi:hypothetical protein
MGASKNPEEASRGEALAERTYHVAPGDGGWVVKAGDQAGRVAVYPNKLAAVSAARRLAAEAGSASVVVHRRDGRIESKDTARVRGFIRRFWPTVDVLPSRISPTDSTPTEGYPPSPEYQPPPLHGAATSDEDDLLGELSRKTGEGPDEVLRKALALYKAALGAVEEGKAIGIASDSGVLETEFVGF